MFDKIETFVADHETSVKVAAIAVVAGVGAYLGVRFGIKDLKVEMVLQTAEGVARTVGKTV